MDWIFAPHVAMNKFFLFHQSCTGTNFLISSNVEFPVSMTSGGCAGGCIKLQVLVFSLFVFINYCFITSSLISI